MCRLEENPALPPYRNRFAVSPYGACVPWTLPCSVDTELKAHCVLRLRGYILLHFMQESLRGNDQSPKRVQTAARHREKDSFNQGPHHGFIERVNG
eukprot:921690-Pleurochrysis_carterae.AAC.1